MFKMKLATDLQRKNVCILHTGRNFTYIPLRLYTIQAVNTVSVKLSSTALVQASGYMYLCTRS